MDLLETIQHSQAAIRAAVTDNGRIILHLREKPTPVHASLLPANAPSNRPISRTSYCVRRGMFAHVGLVSTTDGAALQLDLIALGRSTSVVDSLDEIFRPWFPNAQALVDNAVASESGLSEIHYVLGSSDFQLPHDLLRAFIHAYAQPHVLVPASLFLLDVTLVDPDLGIE